MGRDSGQDFVGFSECSRLIVTLLFALKSLRRQEVDAEQMVPAYETIHLL